MTSADVAAPGDTVGILGGGQLGRMLALAAARLGLDVAIYTPERDSPAARVAARSWCAAWDDRAALAEFAASCRVVTLEFENVPVDTVEHLGRLGGQVRPGAAALAVAQDRLSEKTFFAANGLTPAPFERIDGPDALPAALERLGGRGILKTRRAGYDGKGQARLNAGDDPRAAWAAIGGAPAILEGFVDFVRELSVVVARGPDGAATAYDVCENRHAGGVLRQTVVPAAASPAVQAESVRLACELAARLDYVGVLTLELFETADGRLIANEFAPRVHNSGHWTEDGCLTGQFEQHVRAVCGWPAGDVTRHSDVVMDNLLGEEAAGWRNLAADPLALRLYGKREALPGRKMGHVTRLTPRR